MRKAVSTVVRTREALASLARRQANKAAAHAAHMAGPSEPRPSTCSAGVPPRWRARLIPPLRHARAPAARSAPSQLGPGARATPRTMGAFRPTLAPSVQLDDDSAPGHGKRVLRAYSRDEVRSLLDRALNRSSAQTLQWLGGTVLALLLGWLLYREQAKAKMTQELADLASRSLGDKSVQTKTAEVSMHTLATLLADERTRQRTLQWLQGVLEDPQTIGAVVHLVQQVLTNEQVVDKVSDLMQLVFSLPGVRAAVLAGLQDVICSDAFLQTAASFGMRLIGTEDVTDAATELLQAAATSLLEDALVREHAREFVLSLLDADSLQRKTGDHLRGAVVRLFNPVAWLRSEPTAASAGTLREADKSASALAASQQSQREARAKQQQQLQPPSAEEAAAAKSAAANGIGRGGEATRQLARTADAAPTDENAERPLPAHGDELPTIPIEAATRVSLPLPSTSPTGGALPSLGSAVDAGSSGLGDAMSAAAAAAEATSVLAQPPPASLDAQSASDSALLPSAASELRSAVQTVGATSAAASTEVEQLLVRRSGSVLAGQAVQPQPGVEPPAGAVGSGGGIVDPLVGLRSPLQRRSTAAPVAAYTLSAVSVDDFAAAAAVEQAAAAAALLPGPPAGPHGARARAPLSPPLADGRAAAAIDGAHAREAGSLRADETAAGTDAATARRTPPASERGVAETATAHAAPPADPQRRGWFSWLWGSSAATGASRAENASLSERQARAGGIVAQAAPVAATAAAAVGPPRAAGGAPPTPPPIGADRASAASTDEHSTVTAAGALSN